MYNYTYIFVKKGWEAMRGWGAVFVSRLECSTAHIASANSPPYCNYNCDYSSLPPNAHPHQAALVKATRRHLTLAATTFNLLQPQ